MYSLSFKFFRLRVVGRALRSPFLFLLFLRLYFISFSRYLWKLSVFASSGLLHLRFVMSVSFVVLVHGNLRRCLPWPEASSNIARCRTFIEPVDFWSFSTETWGRSYCLRSRPIKTSRKLNIMRQILHLLSSSFETFKIYYLIFNFTFLDQCAAFADLWWLIPRTELKNGFMKCFTF